MADITPNMATCQDRRIAKRAALVDTGEIMRYEDLHDTETRQVDPVTQGAKGRKLTQMGALDPVALIELARVAGYGAAKYSPHNYLKGYDWALSFDAMQRHAMLFWAGEDLDTESGQLHMAMVAWHALALVSFMARGVGMDTRPPRLDSQSAIEWPDHADMSVDEQH